MFLIVKTVHSYKWKVLKLRYCGSQIYNIHGCITELNCACNAYMCVYRYKSPNKNNQKNRSIKRVPVDKISLKFIW